MVDQIITFPGTTAYVDDIPDLRAVDSDFLVNKTAMQVGGGAAFADGYGGLYFWNSASLTADDGRTVIKPNDRTSLQAGRWILTGSLYDKFAVGNTTLRNISTNLAGGIIPANIGPVYIGTTVASADAITIDGTAAWPPGIAYRRALGTVGTPTPVTEGTQEGYIDWRGGNYDGLGGFKMYNNASFDVLVAGGFSIGPGQPPRTFMRFSICATDNGAREAMRLIPYGSQGFGLYVGYLAEDGLTVRAPFGGSKPTSYAVSTANDWVVMTDSRPASGNSFGHRIDTLGATVNDYILYGASGVSGDLKFSVRGNGDVYAAGRGWFGSLSASSLGPLAVGYVKSTQNDWASVVESLPSSGVSYGHTVLIKGETTSDYLYAGRSGAGLGTEKFSVRGNGAVDAAVSYAVAGTKVIGAQGTAILNASTAAGAPTQTDFNNLVTKFNDLLARVRAHGLIAT